MDVCIVFPHQLFKQHPAIEKERAVYIVEEALYFNQFIFHKQKLLLHRASMQFYAEFLTTKKLTVHYINAQQEICSIEKLVQHLADKKVKQIHIAEVADNWLQRKLQKACIQATIELIIYRTPNFLNSMEEVSGFFKDRKIYFQTDFYIDQRKKRKLLLDASGKPQGGKWIFDADNRLKFPKQESAPAITLPAPNKYIKEAIYFTQKNYPNNYGSLNPPFVKTNSQSGYPCTFEEAENWLDDFLKVRFSKFGIYEDAMAANEHVLHHSVLTPMLNIGLLNPQQVIDKALVAAVKYNVPLNSLEGFIRQVAGWREFIRIVYEREGSKQRTKNYWGFTRKIPRSFWNATTGIEPVDIVIKKTLQSGYSHHIERLMVLGNFMLLCEFDPDEVYKWFMEMYVDAYDWVMVPNVYGMTQFADGGLMTTKPYISGSNYLMKMGDWPKGNWQQIWDGLFWRFMHVHRGFFLTNPRLGMLVNTFDKMSTDKKNIHLANAENFLHQLDQSLI